MPSASQFVPAVINVTCSSSVDNGNGTFTQQVAGTSMTVNGVPNTSLSIQATLVSATLLFATDATGVMTIAA